MLMKNFMKTGFCLIFLLSVFCGASVFSLNESKALATPVGVVATADDDQSDVRWADPSMVKTFRNDDGECAGGIGSTIGTSYTVLGVAHRTPAELYAMSWLTMKNDATYNSINIFVFDLDSKGNPTSKILFSAMKVPNEDKDWSSYTFPIPVKAPNGFLIGVSIDGTGNVGIGADTGKSKEFPFVPMSNYIAGNYASSMESFSSLDAQGFKSNLMIRATGTPLSGASKSEIITFDKLSTVDMEEHRMQIERIALPDGGLGSITSYSTESDEPIVGYRVWRFKDGDELSEGKWTLLTNNTITTLSHTDKGWSGLSQGCYRYAVRAVYGSGSSVAVISNMVAKSMLTKVEVSVKTNLASVVADGALVRLINKDGDSKHVYDEVVDGTGKVSLENVWKGRYDVEVSKFGFVDVRAYDVDLSTNNSYTLGAYTLNEIIENPYNLEITKTYIPNQRLLKWNNVEHIGDDFEGHKDFIVNSSGIVGWSYIDGDNAPTYGVNNVKFDNMQSKMAYIAFNPSQTTPPMSQILAARPHSGLKYLASFAVSPTQSVPNPPANDDYLISPELNYTEEFELKFWAKGYLPDYVERFKVGYSTTGKSKGDFRHWVTESPVSTTAEWKEYSYVIPADAKYVTIQYVSRDCFLFMVDDVYIGPKDAGAVVQKYEIYLDGVKVGESDKKEYTFSNLGLGKHTAGVKAVFLTSTTEMTTIDFTVDDKSFKVNGLVRDNNDVTIIDAEVKITGSNLYETTTNNAGVFEFPAIFVGNDYSITVNKAGLATYTKKFDVVNADVVMNDIHMNDMPMKPGSVVVKGNDAQVNISWLDPTQMVTFRRDDGVPTGGLGSNQGTERTVVGAVYNTPTILHNMSWMTAKDGENTVNLFVFDLKDGRPTSNVLFKVENIYNKGLEFNTYTFDEPINCPNGFLLGVSGTVLGNVAVACDGGTSTEWPFIPNINYLAIDYTAILGGFETLDKSFPRNLMLRGEGLIIYDNKVSNMDEGKSLTGYKVWRLKQGQESRPNEWVAITENTITATSCSDAGWGYLAPGKYKYAVKAFYSADVVSDASFSNAIDKEAVTAITVKVKTNVTPNSATGATVKLQDKVGVQSYDAVVDADGMAKFDRVQKGVYDITVRLAGFAMLSIVDMDFSTSNSYVVGPFTMKEMLVPPTDLVVVKEETDFERLFTWKYNEGEARSCFADFYSQGFATYELFVDDVMVGQTAELFYRLTNLEHGTRKAGVRIRTTEGVSEIVTIDFEVPEIRVGVAGVEDEGMLRVYPNPVTDGMITIENGREIEQVEVYNGVGKLVKILFGNTTVNVSELSSGVYFIKVYSGSNVEVCKFIIK